MQPNEEVGPAADKQLQRKRRGRSIARALWPESPIAVCSLQVVVSRLQAGRWDFGPARKQLYWYVGTWLLFRAAKWVYSSEPLRELALKVTKPFRDWFVDIIDWFTGEFFQVIDWGDLLQYLSGRQFDPVVMCESRQSKKRQKFPPRSSKPKPCRTRFCRFGVVRGIPGGVDRKKVPGSKRLRIRVQDGDKGSSVDITGRLDSWSATEVAFTVSGATTWAEGEGKELVIRPHIFSPRQKMVIVNLEKAERRGDLAIALSPWTADDCRNFRTDAPAIPLHRSVPIDKNSAWWQDAVRLDLP